MKTNTLNDRTSVRDAVRETDGKIAASQQNGCCECDDPTGCCPPGCCGH